MLAAASTMIEIAVPSVGTKGRVSVARCGRRRRTLFRAKQAVDSDAKKSTDDL